MLLINESRRLLRRPLVLVTKLRRHLTISTPSYYLIQFNQNIFEHEKLIFEFSLASNPGICYLFNKFQLRFHSFLDNARLFLLEILLIELFPI
jgi:hypothetical protein